VRERSFIPRLLESARSGRKDLKRSFTRTWSVQLRGHQETEETPPQKHNRMSEARHRRRAGCRGLKSFARVAKRTCEKQRAKQADLGGVESSSYLGPITRTRAKAKRIQEEPSCSYEVVGHGQPARRRRQRRRRSEDDDAEGDRFPLAPPSPMSCESSETTEHPASTLSRESSFAMVDNVLVAAEKKEAAVDDADEGCSAAITNFLDKLEARQSLKADRARREYNFDFDAGRPLRGEIEWTKA